MKHAELRRYSYQIFELTDRDTHRLNHTHTSTQTDTQWEPTQRHTVTDTHIHRQTDTQTTQAEYTDDLTIKGHAT